MLHHPSAQQLSAHTNPSDMPPPQVPLALQRGGPGGPVTQAPSPEGSNDTQPPQAERTPPRGLSNTPTFTWMNRIPLRLQDRLKWQQVDTSQVTTPVILLLYSGKDDAGSLDSCIHAYHPHLSPHVISVDNRRDPGSIGNDMLQDQPYHLLCSLASQGQFLFFLGIQLQNMEHTQVVP